MSYYELAQPPNRTNLHGFGAIPPSGLPMGVRESTLDSYVPPHTIRSFHGPEDTVAELRKAVLGPRGERSVLVYQQLEQIVRGLQPKDYASEILAVRHWVATYTRYKNDPLSTELISDPQRLVEQIQQHGRAVGDCDDIAGLMATLMRQLGREAQWVTVGFQVGGPHSHIFTRVLEPKTRTWYVCDPVAGTDEQAMLARVKTYRIWRID